MFRLRQFIATGFAIIALGSAAATAGDVTRHEEDTVTVTASTPTRGGDPELTDLQPFTHIAYIPADADLSSIRMEGIKAVKVATKRRSLTTARYCEHQTWSEPGGSMYCPYTTDESQVPAYRVTYSYRGQPMASDEYGNAYFLFSVDLRPDEISPGLRQALSARKISRTDASTYFQITTSRDSIHQVTIDEANSTFCDGNYVDGNWTRSNPTCEDSIAYDKVASTSPYITVEIDPASHFVTTAVTSKSWTK